MGNWISTTEKSSFLKWFLDHHQLKHREARMFLEHIIKKHHIVENLTFTEKIKVNERTVVISSVNSDEPGFVYYYPQGKSENVSMALSAVMNNPSSKLNIIINFYGKQSNHRYLRLIETKKDSLKIYRQYEQYSKEADALINKLMLEQEKKLLKEQIDEALDKRDEQQFKKLLIKLQQLEKTIEQLETG